MLRLFIQSSTVYDICEQNKHGYLNKQTDYLFQSWNFTL